MCWLKYFMDNDDGETSRERARRLATLRKRKQRKADKTEAMREQNH